VRIVLFPSAYAPAVGGVEELTRRLALQLGARGHDVEVWTFRHPAELAADEVIEDVVVRRFSFPLPAASFGAVAKFSSQAPRALRALSQAVKQFRPDLLHVQCFSAQGMYATALAARHRLPLAISLQGETVMDDTDIYERSVILRLGLRTALRLAPAVTGCSQFVIDDAEKRFGLTPGKGIVIPNGVELAGDEQPRPLDLPFKRFVFAVGRVVPKKGFDLLIDAFVQVAAEHPDVGLVVGGSGSASEALAAQASRLELADRIILPGRLDRAAVAWAMDHAEVFVLPSRVEPFGIVVLEAMRAGCPVVVSCHGGALEIVRHGRDGLVADPFDPQDLAEGMSALLSDPSRASHLAATGRVRVATFSWSLIVERYEALYRQARSLRLAS